jgi:hypothetical protein
MSEIDNYQDIIDSRDVEQRIAELHPFKVVENDITIEEFATEGEAAEFIEGKPEAGDTGFLPVTEIVVDEDEAEELRLLTELRDDVNSSEWDDGLVLIRDSFFEDYAREMAEDLYGKQLGEATWPFTSIDWEQAADELMVDYISVLFDGVTYYFRS